MWLFICVVCLGVFANAANIELPECEPPDYPEWGGYEPRQDFYVAGDVIHYYCDTDTHIGGNYYRRCEDTGDWTGEAPVCDSAAAFSSVSQSSTVEPQPENEAEKAADALRSTCALTAPGDNEYWMGVLATPGQLFRVSIFVPKREVAYEVLMVKKDNTEFSCGKRIGRVDYLNWEFHNCPEPNNTDVVGVKVKSLSPSLPLQLCEVVAHTITFPSCVDPHVRIENGRLQLSRKTASLVCNTGYTRSPETRLNCIRHGVWTRRTLYCAEKSWEVEKGDATVERDP